ncbi:MAG: transcription termination factor Rho [Deltaproteobacteria bacterium]|nr:MAG: transcription termination factor Rho [Deltaproteobacteria bacterium]
MSLELDTLQDADVADLIKVAKDAGVPEPENMRRSALVFAIAKARAKATGVELGRGVLEVHGEGFGFLRSPEDNYLPGAGDIYVSQSQIRRFKLKTGDTVVGHVRPPKEGERYTALLRVETVNGDPPGIEPPSFDNLTAIYPDDRIPLDKDPMLRPLDMAAPMGLGQRGILVAPSRTGRVELLHRLADVLTTDEDLDVTILLIDERPEEIQEWRRSTTAEVIATPFDEQPGHHIQVADIVFERARRMVERGDDVVLIVDSLSRLLRACMAELPGSGRDIGGVDGACLHRIRRYMGAARALEEGGSLTVIGVVSGDPGNRVDQALFEDLRDVVNWEATLSRELADRGIRPPLDVHRSGTRRGERLVGAEGTAERNRWRGSLTGDAVEDGAAVVALTHAPHLDSVASTGQ